MASYPFSLNTVAIHQRNVDGTGFSEGCLDTPMGTG